jgi:menaquinol-cytochrome c reductase iron-sulfur subunit
MIEAQENKSSVSRRKLLVRVGVALNAIAGALIGIPLLAFVVHGLTGRKLKDSWIKLGPVTQFPEGETRLSTYRNPFNRPWDGETADVPCWVRHIEGEKFQVFAINCTHLGCPVRWFPGSHLFMCPCHGGSFYEDGSRASGPPPRGLFEYQYKIEDGNLIVLGGHLPTLAQPLSSKNTPCQKPCTGAEPSSNGLIHIDGGPRAC